MKIKRNAPIAKGEKTRKKWNLGEMEINDVVDIKEKEEWLPTIRYIHAFAGRQTPPWKFSANWIKEKSFGRIRRVQ